MELKESKTAKNLHTALMGESLARNKYSFYAAHARKCGETEVAELFEHLAMNEMMHAKAWFEYLYPQNDSVKEDLSAAAAGEYAEWHSMYPEFAAKAREEGFDDIAQMFELVAKIEYDHEMQFMQMLLKLSTKQKALNEADSTAPDTPSEVKTVQGYRCQFCGAVFENRPDVCDVCKSIGSFDACTYRAKS